MRYASLLAYAVDKILSSDVRVKIGDSPVRICPQCNIEHRNRRGFCSKECLKKYREGK